MAFGPQRQTSPEQTSGVDGDRGSHCDRDSHYDRGTKEDGGGTEEGGVEERRSSVARSSRKRQEAYTTVWEASSRGDLGGEGPSTTFLKPLLRGLRPGRGTPGVSPVFLGRSVLSVPDRSLRGSPSVPS